MNQANYRGLHGVFATLLDLVYPRRCAGCGQDATAQGGHLCWDCTARLSIVSRPFCDVCGDPVDGLFEERYTCRGCRRRRPRFELARSAARFRGPLREALHAFKYAHATHLCADLAGLLDACVATHYAAARFDAVAFVPLHAGRERERTYNQAQLLARGLAHRLGVPLFRGLCRARATRTQTDLSSRERRQNVKDAFVVTRPEWVEGRCLLLVDDVMTTGATVGECSRVLRNARAAGVYVVTVARG